MHCQKKVASFLKGTGAPLTYNHYTNGNQIVAVMAKGLTYEISTANGEIVANGTITSDNAILYLANTKGIYLVKIGEKSCKVIVK